MAADADTEVLTSLLLDARVGWSLGRSGAIAEFYRDENEPTLQNTLLSIATARGALRVVEDRHDARLFAGETLSHAGHGWSQWLSLCLPKGQSRMSAHGSITELGPDELALRPESRKGVLFDLGIGGPYFQLCVRTEVAGLVRELRSAIGRPVLEVHSLVQSLMSLSPTRVFESRLGRIEVTQPIATVNGKSPEGPHTHFLPHLIEGDGADSPSAPPGWVAQLVAYPPNPLRDARGQSKPFTIEEYRSFQELLNRFGNPEHQSVKRKVFSAVRSGASADVLTVDAGGLDSVRVALLQLLHLDGESLVLSHWWDAYHKA